MNRYTHPSSIINRLRQRQREMADLADRREQYQAVRQWLDCRRTEREQRAAAEAMMNAYAAEQQEAGRAWWANWWRQRLPRTLKTGSAA